MTCSRPISASSKRSPKACGDQEPARRQPGTPGGASRGPGPRPNFDIVTQVQVTHAWLRLRDSLESTATAWYLAELADRRWRSVTRPRVCTCSFAVPTSCWTRNGRGPGRPLVRDASGGRVGVRPEVDRCVECDRMLEADEQFAGYRRSVVSCAPLPGPPADRAGLSLDGLKVLKAYQRMDVEALAGLRLRPPLNARLKERCATSCACHWSATPARSISS